MKRIIQDSQLPAVLFHIWGVSVSIIGPEASYS
jgi:hypothetical protein